MISVNSLTQQNIEDCSKNTLRITGTVLSLNNIAKELQTRRSFDTVEIFCSNTIFLDADLKLLGKNLIIIAPIWTVTKSITIDLSGEEGQNAAGYDGIHGKVGGPGGNGGNFVGRAVEVRNACELTIRLNGGNGGAGANGKDGRNGTPGKDGVQDSVYNRDTSVLFGSYQANTSTWNLQLNYEYRSEGTQGEDGQSGGMGGYGGIRGLAGKINFVIIYQPGMGVTDKYNLEKFPGKDGVAGCSGNGGTGGKGGHTYFGIYQKREIYLLPPGFTRTESLNSINVLDKGSPNHNTTLSVIFGFRNGWLQKPWMKKEEDGTKGKVPIEKNEVGIMFPRGKPEPCVKIICKEFQKYYQNSEEHKAKIFCEFFSVQ